MLGPDDGDCVVDFSGAEGVERVWEGGCCSDLVGELLDAVEDHFVCFLFLILVVRMRMLRTHAGQRGIYIYPSPPHPWLDVHGYNTCISVIVDKTRIASPHRV